MVRKFLTKNDYLFRNNGGTRDEWIAAKDASHPHLRWKWYLNGRLSPSLLRVCKQVYAEGNLGGISQSIAKRLLSPLFYTF